jgi:hypothetical protein
MTDTTLQALERVLLVLSKDGNLNPMLYDDERKIVESARKVAETKRAEAAA